MNNPLNDFRPAQILCAFAIAWLAGVASAQAPTAEADFIALAKDGKRAEIEALARERLARNPKDDIAIWYLARLVAGDATKRDEVVKRAEQCVIEQPQSARCHSAVGSLYGALAMSGGMTSGMKYVGKIKDALQKAVELAPSNYDMRRDLIQFYLQAPGIAGGSVRRATENAEAFTKIDPFRGQILMADVLAYEKKFDRAEATLQALKPADAAQTEALTSSLSSLGFSMINGEQHKRAQALFERLVGQRASNAIAHFGLGRALLEQKQIDAAITAMERALQIDPKINAHYRLGIAYQTRGDKPKAIALFTQFLTYATSGRAAEDARKRLDELKRG